MDKPKLTLDQLETMIVQMWEYEREFMSIPTIISYALKGFSTEHVVMKEDILIKKFNQMFPEDAIKE